MTDTTQAVGEIIKTDVRGRMRVSTERRQRLLAEYDQSGLSAKKFAQLAGIKYPTLANWLQKRRRLGSAPATSADSVRWLEAVVEKGNKPADEKVTKTEALVVHGPGGVWWKIEHEDQARWAAMVLRHLGAAC